MTDVTRQNPQRQPQVIVLRSTVHRPHLRAHTHFELQAANLTASTMAKKMANPSQVATKPPRPMWRPKKNIMAASSTLLWQVQLQYSCRSRACATCEWQSWPARWRDGRDLEHSGLAREPRGSERRGVRWTYPRSCNVRWRGAHRRPCSECAAGSPRLPSRPLSPTQRGPPARRAGSGTARRTSSLRAGTRGWARRPSRANGHWSR